MHPFALNLLAQTSAASTTILGDTGVPWLSLLVFTPLIGVLALMLIPGEQKGILKNTALITSLVVFVMSFSVLFEFDAGITHEGPFTFQLTNGPYPWIPSIGVNYYVGVDGISLWLVMLTTFIMPIGIYSTYSAVDKYIKEFMICLLILETGMLGALVSVDMLLFYIFWEMMLIPMYLIIGVWGGEDRVRAAIKFFIYTMVGSLLMLIGLLYIYFKTGAESGHYSFMLTDMMAVDLSQTEQMWLFGAFFLAFAIKVPLFPFHTWLPHAHVQAPTVGSVILAGVLLKMGTYGLLRFAFPFFPDATVYFAPYIAVLCVIGIIYGALVAMIQDDVKKVVAYSSVAHLGFCVLGLVAMTPAGIAGGIFVMIAHGIATGALFLCIGVLYERRHTKKIDAFGGVSKAMPIFAVLFMISIFASVGLPGLNGFVGEFLALLGTSKSNILSFEGPMVFMQAENSHGLWQLVTNPATYPVQDIQQAGPELTAFIFAAIGATGVIFAAGYLLWMWRRVMFGPLDKPENKALKDVNLREFLYLVPMVAMAIFMGVFPQFFLGRMEPSIDQYLQYMQNKTTEGTKFIVVEPSDPKWVIKGKMLDKKVEVKEEIPFMGDEPANDNHVHAADGHGHAAHH